MKAHHVCVGGPSGGGKTTYLRELHAEFDGLSVLLSTKDDERAEHAPPKRVLKAGATYPDDLQRVRQWARERPEAVQIIVDEAQNAPSFRDKAGADGPVRRGLHEDRDHAVKWVVSTQNPQDLRTNANKYGPLQQCVTFVWVGVVREWHMGFINWIGIDESKLPDRNLQYVTIDPTVPASVVHRGTTREAYA